MSTDMLRRLTNRRFIIIIIILLLSFAITLSAKASRTLSVCHTTNPLSNFKIFKRIDADIDCETHQVTILVMSTLHQGRSHSSIRGIVLPPPFLFPFPTSSFPLSPPFPSFSYFPFSFPSRPFLFPEARSPPHNN